MMQKLFRNIALTSLILVTAACGRQQPLRVNDVVVTLSPVDSNPSAVHFNVHGGPEDVRLLSIFSPSAVRSEMHESSVDPKTKLNQMRKINEVKIPAGETVEFKRGGLHGMVWGVNQLARRSGEMEFEFVFSNRDRILVEAKVQELDGSEPDERKAYLD